MPYKRRVFFWKCLKCDRLYVSFSSEIPWCHTCDNLIHMLTFFEEGWVADKDAFVDILKTTHKSVEEENDVGNNIGAEDEVAGTEPTLE